MKNYKIRNIKLYDLKKILLRKIKLILFFIDVLVFIFKKYMDILI